MDRVTSEKFNGNPAWRAAFETALAETATIGMSADHADAVFYAETRADILTSSGGQDAREAANRAATDALLARLRSTAPEAEASQTAGDSPSPAQQAVARAVGGINARRGPTTSGADEASPAPAQAHPDQEAGAIQSAFKRSADRINAGR